jgi:tetraacyldisaccharide 4'-kinase
LLDLLYAQTAATRRRFYERHPEARRRLRRPVVSVGNLSVGGTGKSPLVAQLAEWLIGQGERPAILSRGYKRRIAEDGVTVVSDGHTLLCGVDRAGDEPLMLAREVPGAVVCVCEDRHLGGVVAERVHGATVHLLDDGFQHVQLARDLDVLVTAPGEITNGHVLPRGRLRERRDAAARAQFVVVVGADDDAARIEAWELGVSGFSAARRNLGPLAAQDVLGQHAPIGADRLADMGVVAVAGIANPESFFAMLREAGFVVKDTLSFGDHHRYTAADVAHIESVARSAKAAAVLSTAKDAVRLETLLPLPFPVHVVPMRLVLEHWDALTMTVREALGRARAAA